MNKFKLGKFLIKENSKPFVIAELSANHNGKISNIFKLIDKAKDAGANAVKLQTYTADSMTLDSRKKYFYLNKGLWAGKYLYDLYKIGSTPLSWHKKIFSYARKKNILCFSTAFDLESVKFLNKINTPAFKVSSFEINDLPLIKEISLTKKPIIFSTGMASFKDIDLALSTARKNGSKNIALLHCISNYPAKPRMYNLKFLLKLKKKYKLIIGLSDHTLCSTVAACSVSLGARIIEKHIKLKRQSGIDSKFSMDVVEFKKFVKIVNDSYESLGTVNFDRKKIEGNNFFYRRSIFISKDVKKGDAVTKNNIKVIRPSAGLHSKYYYKIIGKKFNRDINEGEPLKLTYIY